MEKIIGIGVILKTPGQLFLLQERDDKAVLHPSRIAPFGGGIEGSENPLQCAQREIFEELNLKIDVNHLKTLGLFESHNQSGDFIEMFLLEGVELEKLKLQEGRSIIEISKKEALENPKVTDFTKEVLNTL